MNVNNTMLATYIAHERLQSLAQHLKEQGCKMAAAELKREADKLGRQLIQIEGVLSDYEIDISAAQLTLPTKPPGLVEMKFQVSQ